MVKERFPLLAEAALIVASPQIRNQGTLGGNVAQDARCWYYRAGWPCYGAGIDITKLTSLQPGDLLTAIRIPNTFAGKAHYFEKVRDRQVWDFALVNIAAAMNVAGTTMND